MNPEIKEKWLTALRSGDYVQGRQYLQTAQGTFCCLGVLCDIAVKEGVIPTPDLRAETPRGWTYGGALDYSDTALPDTVRMWAGLRDNSPVIRLDAEDREEAIVGSFFSLVEENDAGRSFYSIADVIEKYL